MCIISPCWSASAPPPSTPISPRRASPTAIARGLFGKLTLKDCVGRYKKAVDKGLLKVMSKMGISVISSYRGGYNFEAIGLSRTLVGEFFPGMPSRISGIGLPGIAQKVLELHKLAWERQCRAAGRSAASTGCAAPARRMPSTITLIHLLQSAVASNSFQMYKRYAEMVRKQPPVALRDLLDFRTEGRTPISIDEVESITEIRKRLLAPGISLGALSPEAHETLSIAMNRIGARSDSGEGGEDPARSEPRPNGDNASSAIKQIASGRFGVTAEYLNDCTRDRDQGRAGRQAGRGRAAAGLQGHRADRQAAPLHAGRHADQPAAASRHLFDRGSGAADLRPQADQPATPASA